MPKKKGKKFKSKSTSLPISEGLTLNDFANNTVTSGKCRIKKGTSNSLASDVRHIVRDSVEDKDWFEKSWDDFQISSREDESDREECPLKDVKPKRKAALRSTSDTDDVSAGNSYPLDVWYILSRYIRPEDIGRFSQICKSAYAVTQSSSFWTKLYKRNYCDRAVLPLRLQPDSMERLYELRTCVIRSLFHLYPAFKKRIKDSQVHDPHVVLKRKCSMFWHQKGNGVFQYFFKMHENDMDYNYELPSLKDLNGNDLIEALGDINANSQKGCKVLQLTCTTFAAISPTIFGQTLLAVSSTLSSDLRSYNVRLIFGPSHAIQSSRKGLTFTNIPEGSFCITLNSVVLVQVLDWWNPSYPSSTPDSTTDNSNCATVDSFF